ncbi:hypothetical protein CR513_50311, partial [Mucuna pruriens]
MERRLMSAQVGEDEGKHIPSTLPRFGEVVFNNYDGGSNVNIASIRLIEKLNLLNLVYSMPYKLQWLNNKGEMTVTNAYGGYTYSPWIAMVTLNPLLPKEANKVKLKMKIKREKEEKREKKKMMKKRIKRPKGLSIQKDLSIQRDLSVQRKK